MSSQANSISGFIFALLAALFLIATSCIAIQLVIDPKNRYDLVNIPSLEVRKAPMVVSSKDKTNLIKNTNANCIILGTSRAELGINPEHIPDYSCVNLSIIHGSVEDMRDVLRYALKYMDIELIVWGIDFEMFTNMYGKVKHQYHTRKKTAGRKFADRREKEGEKRHATISQLTPKNTITLLELKALFSFQNLQHAFELISGEPIQGSRVHLNNGQRKIDKWQRSFDRNGHLAMFQRNENKFLRANVYLHNENKKYQQRLRKAFTAFSEILSIIDKHDISFYAFISPVHIRQLMLIDASSRFDDFQQWKLDLLSALNKVGRFDLYDFSLIDGVTTEKVPEANRHQAMQWYWEAQHYKEALGDLIIGHMTTNSGQDFLLNVKNSQSFSQRQLAILVPYRNSHPEISGINRKYKRRF